MTHDKNAGCGLIRHKLRRHLLLAQEDLADALSPSWSEVEHRRLTIKPPRRAWVRFHGRCD